MADTYFATFSLGKPGKHPPSLDVVVAEVRKWLLRPRKGVVVKQLKAVNLQGDGEYLAGEGELVVRRHTDSSADILGIRLKHPSSDEPDVEWSSEVVLAQSSAPASELRVSIRTSVRRAGSVVTPLRVRYSRPRIVTDLIARFGAYDGDFRLVEKALQVTPGDFDKHFIEALEHPNRTVPIVVVSATNTDEHLVNGDVIANHLAGLALVCTFSNRFVAMRLTSRLGKEWSCWDGAIRVYWPLPKLAEPPNGHFVIPRRRLEEYDTSADVASELLGMISRAATSRSAVGLARWSELERRKVAVKLEEARQRGDNEELVRLLFAEKEALSQEKTSLEEQLLNAWGELEKARQDATYWRKEYEAARRSHGAVPNLDAEPPAPTTVEEALQQAANMFPERLEFHPNSASNPRTPFEDIESLVKALQFLATQYVDARTGRQRCTDLDTALRNAAGFFYKAGQSEVTVGQFRNEYETTWRNRRIPLEEHIGKGVGRDPRRSIRLGFYFDKESLKVVIGYVGQHQSTTAS